MKIKTVSSLLLAAAILALGMDRPTLAQDASDSARLELIVPAYFYPGAADPYWPALTSAAARVPVTAIMNPASGPGTVLDTNYERVLGSLQQAGGQAIGYVHTQYGNRPLVDVQADINRYLALYPGLDGFFIDEMSNQADSSVLTYYANLYDYIKAMGSDLRVVGNPGTNTAANYLELPAADAVVNFESPDQVYRQYEVSDWVFSAPAQQFGHLVYQSRNKKAMRKVIQQAVARNAGMVYVTNDTLDNPWDTLPRYWNAQVRCVEKINRGADRC